MKLLTRDTDYAVRSLMYMAKVKRSSVLVSELTRELKIPKAFLRRILQSLSKKEILDSQKGKGGGFRLKLPPKKIFVIDLIRIFQGDLKINECLFKKNVCPDIKNCSLRRKIKQMEKLVFSELKDVSVASLLKGGF